MEQQRSIFRAMNTEIEVYMDSPGKGDVKELYKNVELLFQQVERTASRFLPDSELSQLNRSPETFVQVSPLLFDLLQKAVEAYEETDGIFNPTILSHLEAAGYNRSMEQMEKDQDRECPDFDRKVGEVLPCHLDVQRKQVYLPKGVRIDLGGIAKGWTVDKAAELLSPYGAGFVNAGGDIRVFGHGKGPWNIGIEDPFSPERDVAVVTLRKGAVATSSTWKRRWKQGGKWMHHLIDPRTGLPSDSEVVSATVTAPTAVQADVWAKVTLLLGTGQGLAWVKERHAHALIVDQWKQIRSV